MLAPSLAVASIRLRPVPPVVMEEDIRQDLVLEALRVLDKGTLPQDPRWIPRHITLRATQAVARRLAKEKGRQERQASLDDECADELRAATETGLPAPATHNVRPRAHNVRRASTIEGIAHVHMRSRGVMRTRARIAVNRGDELMNTASDHLHPRRQEKGDS
jgi:hypothetical protein